MRVSILKLWSIALIFIIRIRFPKDQPLRDIIIRRYNEETLRIYRQLERTEKKLKKLQCDVQFLIKCESQQLIPKFLRFKLHNPRLTSSCSYRTFQQELLRNEIKFKEKCISKRRIECDNIAKSLRSKTFWLDFHHLYGIIMNSTQSLTQSTKCIHAKKLEALGYVDRTSTTTVNSVINLSKYPLSSDEKDLLSKGLKYVIGPSKPSLHYNFLNFEKFYQKLREIKSATEEKPICETFLSRFKYLIHSYHSECNKFYKSHSNRSTDELNIIKKLSNNKDLIITRPDKGNGVVVMDKSDYILKMNDVLNDNSKFERLSSDVSTKSLATQIRKQEDKLNRTLRKFRDDSFIDKATYKYLYASGSQIGYLYGLPKIHKPNIPLRPILSAIDTFNYRLSKFLVPLLSPITTNKYTVRDSFTFAKEITNLDFKDVTMTSFDVKSLYTNIPLEETISICTSLLKKDPKHLLHSLPHILQELLTLATSNSMFLFNNHLYKQVDGLAMGSPLGPALANAFLCFYEERWLDECPNEFRPVYYRRYIDDTFILFKHPSHVSEFLQYLNSRHANITFTHETEKNNNLPFLDVKVTKESTGQFSTSVYRKPTYTGLITLFSSFGPLCYKSNLISALVHRAWKLTSNYDYLDDEIKFLSEVFCNNGYPDSFFYRHLSNTLHKFFKPKVPNFHVPRAIVYFPLEYYGHASIKFKNTIIPVIQSQLPYLKVRMAFRSSRTIGSFFRIKDSMPKLLRSLVIYKYTCEICQDFYIGKTSRWLGERISEHSGVSHRTGNSISNPLYSAIREHMHEHNHHVNPSSFTIISKGKSDLDLDILESLHGLTNKASICKNQVSLTLNTFP